jgi:hypothetical protein
MVVSRRELLLGGAACLAAAPARAALPVPAGDSLVFQVMRGGESIGEHRLDFSRDGDVLTVVVAVQLVVKFGPIPVFRYKHHNVERWQGDQFLGFDSETNDDGDQKHISAQRQADGIRVQGTGLDAYVAPAESLAATHWNRRQLDGPLINTQNGKLLRPTVADLGSETVALANGTPVTATHYALSGDVALDLWYDPTPRWTALRFVARDGSIVEYRRI